MENKEILKEISKCKNVEEIFKLAKDNNYEISKEKAEELFNKTHSSGELSDAELNGVAGGGCRSSNNKDVPKPECYEDPKFSNKNEVTFLFNPGDKIKFFFSIQKNNIGKIYDATIVSTRIGYSINNFKQLWHDVYTVSYFCDNRTTKKDIFRYDIVKS